MYSRQEHMDYRFDDILLARFYRVLAGNLVKIFESGIWMSVYSLKNLEKSLYRAITKTCI